MRLKRIVVVYACLPLLGVLAAGCSSEGGGETTVATARGGETTVGAVAGEATVEATAPPRGDVVAATIEVKETEFGLEPAEITLDRPGVYVFKAENAGNLTHALSIRMSGTEVTAGSTGNLEPGESDELKAALEVGNYELFCPVDGHEELGMKSPVTVETPSEG